MPNLSEQYAEKILSALPLQQSEKHREHVLEMCALLEKEAGMNAQKIQIEHLNHFVKNSISEVDLIFGFVESEYQIGICETAWNKITTRRSQVAALPLTAKAQGILEVVMRFFDAALPPPKN